MEELSDKEIAQYFRRCYTAVDGLWFMKVEERSGFDEALAVDGEVWKVLPKIQARTLKTLTRRERGMDALIHCFTTKLNLEGYRYTITGENDRSFTVRITGCPWYDALIRAGRERIAGTVGARICRTEYAVWAEEFDSSVVFTMNQLLCDGSECCLLEFRKSRDGLKPDEAEENDEQRNGSRTG
ncbi:MAG: DUF6125 family protein [Candidatus Latescibacterota bacterium]